MLAIKAISINLRLLIFDNGCSPVGHLSPELSSTVRVNAEASGIEQDTDDTEKGDCHTATLLTLTDKRTSDHSPAKAPVEVRG